MIFMLIMILFFAFFITLLFILRKKLPWCEHCLIDLKKMTQIILYPTGRGTEVN